MVGVVEEHAVISTPEGGLHHHQAVSADGEMAAAEGAGDGGEESVVDVLRQIVEENEVVARSAHFCKAQERTSFPCRESDISKYIEKINIVNHIYCGKPCKSCYRRAEEKGENGNFEKNRKIWKKRVDKER